MKNNIIKILFVFLFVFGLSSSVNASYSVDTSDFGIVNVFTNDNLSYYQLPNMWYLKPVNLITGNGIFSFQWFSSINPEVVVGNFNHFVTNYQADVIPVVPSPTLPYSSTGVSTSPIGGYSSGYTSGNIPDAISKDSAKDIVVDKLGQFGSALLVILGFVIGIGVAYLVFRFGWSKIKKTTPVAKVKK